MLNVTMAKSTTNVKQKKTIGRPVEIGATEFLGVRLPKVTTAKIDKLAADHDMSRSETVRAVMAAHEAWEPFLDFLRKTRKPEGPDEIERYNKRAFKLQQQALAKTDEIFGRKQSGN